MKRQTANYQRERERNLTLPKKKQIMTYMSLHWVNLILIKRHPFRIISPLSN